MLAHLKIQALSSNRTWGKYHICSESLVQGLFANSDIYEAPYVSYIFDGGFPFPGFLAMPTWKWKSFHQHSINGESSSWLILLLQRLPQNQHNLQESYRSILFPLGIYPFLNFWSVVSGMSMFSLYFQFYSIQTWLLAWNGFTNSIELSNCLFPLPTLLHTRLTQQASTTHRVLCLGLYCHRFCKTINYDYLHGFGIKQECRHTWKRRTFQWICVHWQMYFIKT